MKWQFWIDRGGTFTDIVALGPDRRIRTCKMLSDNPAQYPDAAVAGIRRILGVSAHDSVPVERIACVKMGTTVATNALLERKGEPTVFLTTRGFRDALRIAYQNRPRLFDRHIVLPEMLYERCIEVDERLDAAGNTVRELDLDAVRCALQEAYNDGLRAVAIVLMHAWRRPDHEIRLARLARDIGYTQVSASHEVSPLIKFVSRGDTTVVDAYLSPILARYVQQVAAELPGIPLLFMQSSGGLAHAGRFRGKDAILSGPAGGIVGMARTSEHAGFSKVIGFDMGGTSTDVSHYAGEFEREFETQVAGVRMRAPMMSIHTVAAGGGSILHFDGARLRVGPDSAGAEPGPASYRHGGPLTVTDCNVMLGKIQPDFFPKVFGPQADMALDAAVVGERFAKLAEAVEQATGTALNPAELAEGFLAIAVGNMAEAIKRISIQQGHDVTAYTLAVFGGAGGQHACLVADALGMSTIMSHPYGGVLSAYGMGLADQIEIRQQTVEQALTESLLPELDEVRRRLAVLAKQALDERHGQPAARDNAGSGVAGSVHDSTAGRQLDAEAGPHTPSEMGQEAAAAAPADRDRHYETCRVHLKYEGTDSSLEVMLSDSVAAMRRDFEQAYRRRYSFLMPARRLIVEALSVEAGLRGDTVQSPPMPAGVRQGPPVPRVRRAMYCAGLWRDTPLYEREDLQAGDVLEGPAIVSESSQTIVVEPEWQAQLSRQGHWVLRRQRPLATQKDVGSDVNPIMLEVFNKLFMSIAEQMGVRLQNTAYSVNIKERLDFSCAIFDAQGNLIANAPHMPVHLGSMSESIKTIMRENAGRMQPGDAYVVNDPYHGGTHLPDVTVITPVFDAAGVQLLFFVGSRGHHADIGGLTPGSMPPDSRRVEDEGVLFTNFQLVRDGVFREEEARKILASGAWPARNPNQNLADLRAQIAANEKGLRGLLDMCDQFGLDVVQAYMRHVQDNAEEAVRKVITRLRDGQCEYRLDNGAIIRVSLRVNRDQRSATIDFTGSSPQLDNNFNAPASIAVAAVLYVFRTLVDDDIPLNAGCLKPLEIIVPEGSMLRPKPPAAVVAGNVETSMCIVNALYGALGVLAESQGSMNNFTFGNQRYQYYETVAGGTGAGPERIGLPFEEAGGFDGTSVVQAHMTNSRLTDPEVLELRFPVRLDSYAIRAGSGGDGRWRGGDGGVRRLRFLEPMTAAILSNNRVFAPAGLAGGQPGALGRNYVERADGGRTELGPQDSTQMQPDDVFVIETPGGGGYGPAR